MLFMTFFLFFQFVKRNDFKWIKELVSAPCCECLFPASFPLWLAWVNLLVGSGVGLFFDLLFFMDMVLCFSVTILILVLVSTAFTSLISELGCCWTVGVSCSSKASWICGSMNPSSLQLSVSLECDLPWLTFSLSCSSDSSLVLDLWMNSSVSGESEVVSLCDLSSSMNYSSE